MQRIGFTYAILLGVGVVIGWNVFLAQRDHQLFDHHETAKEKYCQQQAGWHPDCNLE